MKVTADDLAVLIATVRARLAAFIFVFFLVFTMSYLFLYSFGAVPKAPVTPVTVATTAADEAVAATSTTATTSEVANVTNNTAPELPISITIDALDRTVTVDNPTSRTIADLDAALLKGVVRHPDSAKLGEDGTILILGHSSYLPTVHNQNFKAFNGIQKLVWGDTIRVRSEEREYVYQVEKVYQAKASDVAVPIANTGARLTLATCDSFGSKDDRFIVEARLLYSDPRTNS